MITYMQRLVMRLILRIPDPPIGSGIYHKLLGRLLPLVDPKRRYMIPVMMKWYPGFEKSFREMFYGDYQ